MELGRYVEKLLPQGLRPAGRTAETAVAASAERAAAVLDHASTGALDRSVLEALRNANAPIQARFPDQLAAKYARMAESPFGFFRGSDGLFYEDLARMEGDAAKAGPRVPLQGDAHPNNLGASLDEKGEAKFGFNDFDEASIGPASLDLKRFGTGMVLALQEAGLSPAQTRVALQRFADSYEGGLRRLAADPGAKAAVEAPATVEDLLKEATGKDEGEWLDKHAPKHDGDRRLLRDETVAEVPAGVTKDLQKAFDRLRASLPADEAKALADYKVIDALSALDGVGSVGRGRYRVLVDAPHAKPMIFEIKEEVPAAAGPLVGDPGLGSEAERGLAVREIMNGRRQPFHGATTLPKSDALMSDSFLGRRLTPNKASLDLTAVTDPGEANALAGYLGERMARWQTRHGAEAGLADAQALLATVEGRPFASELSDFSHGYAQQVQRDHGALKKALETRDPALFGQGR